MNSIEISLWVSEYRFKALEDIPFLKSRAATVNAVMMKRCTP